MGEQKHPDKKKLERDEPYSLYPLTMDEALKRAMEASQQRKDDEQHTKDTKNKKHT